MMKKKEIEKSEEKDNGGFNMEKTENEVEIRGDSEERKEKGK